MVTKIWDLEVHWSFHMLSVSVSASHCCQCKYNIVLNFLFIQTVDRVVIFILSLLFLW